MRALFRSELAICNGSASGLPGLRLANGAAVVRVCFLVGWCVCVCLCVRASECVGKANREGKLESQSEKSERERKASRQPSQQNERPGGGITIASAGL